ncbi:hypothetical protein FACS1894202_04830 [Clostridia bacterium]|nr:hypothetical protein FACS1894202_04830 [Clostridia bacterium]
MSLWTENALLVLRRFWAISSEVPCVFAEHLTDAQKRAYILADNRLAMNAGWDEELLTLEFGELKDLGFDLELTGFDPAEIEKLFAADGDDVQDDDFDLTAALDEAAFVLPGDVWTVGRHKLVCGDATDADTVKLLIAVYRGTSWAIRCPLRALKFTRATRAI